MAQLLTETFRIRFDLGLFDPIEGQPYLQYGEADVNTVGRRGAAAATCPDKTRLSFWRRTRRGPRMTSRRVRASSCCR